MRMSLTVLAVSSFFASAGAAVAQGNAEEGEQVFRKCMACHRMGPEAKNLIGPVLNGVIGRPAGSAEGFAYSELNKGAGANGLVWSEALILAYLEDPTPFLKKFLTDKGKPDLASGATKMVFKLPDETDRKNVIEYIKKFSPAK